MGAGQCATAVSTISAFIFDPPSQTQLRWRERLVVVAEERDSMFAASVHRDGVLLRKAYRHWGAYVAWWRETHETAEDFRCDCEKRIL